MRSPKSLDLGVGPGGNSTTAESSPAGFTKEDRIRSASVCAAIMGTDGTKPMPIAARKMSHVMGSPRGRHALGRGTARIPGAHRSSGLGAATDLCAPDSRFLDLLFFLFRLYLPPDLVIMIRAVQLLFVLFGHLSVDVWCVRRTGAALLFLVHHRARDAIRFLFIEVARLADGELHLRASDAAPAGATRVTAVVIHLGLNGRRVLLHDMCQLVRQELTPARASRVVLSLPEVDVASRSECACAERLIQRIGVSIRVHPHVAEIGVERLSHRGFDAAIEWMSTASAPFDGPLQVRHRIAVPFCAPGRGDHALDESIAVFPLQLKKRRGTCGAGRGQEACRISLIF